MKEFLFNIFVLILFPLALIIALFAAILAFIKQLIKELKDWGDLLTL